MTKSTVNIYLEDKEGELDLIHSFEIESVSDNEPFEEAAEWIKNNELFTTGLSYHCEVIDHV